MPRGFSAKQARSQKRATESGRSTRGSSHMSASQQKGKRYKKKEILNSGSQMNIIHEGVVYIVYFKVANNSITINSMVNQKHISKLACVHNAKDYIIKDDQLISEILSKFSQKLECQYHGFRRQ